MKRRNNKTKEERIAKFIQVNFKLLGRLLLDKGKFEET